MLPKLQGGKTEARVVKTVLSDDEIELDGPFSEACFTSDWSRCRRLLFFVLREISLNVVWAYQDTKTIVRKSIAVFCDVKLSSGLIEPRMQHLSFVTSALLSSRCTCGTH